MFRLLTYNIMHGGGGRLDALAAVIDGCQPDLVLLQEATDPANVQRLAEVTGMAEWRAFRAQSLGFLSRHPVTGSEWVRPAISRHAFVEVVPVPGLRIFGVHLSAVHAAWTEQRRVLELRALLKTVARHQDGFHVLAGDFNTVAPGDVFEASKLAVAGAAVRVAERRPHQVAHDPDRADAGYVDAFRTLHPSDPGLTLPTPTPHVRLDYVFVPRAHAARVARCDVVRAGATAGASDHFPIVADLHIT